MIRAKILLPVLLLAAGLFMTASVADARPVFYRPAPAAICAPAPVVAAPCVTPVVTHYRGYRHVNYRGYRGYHGFRGHRGHR